MLVIALVALALLAAGGVLASAAPAPWRVPLAGLVALHGLLLARRAAAERPCTVDWPGGGAAAFLQRDGRAIALQAVRVEGRGALVRLQGRDHRGVIHRLVWWPDTLDAPTRRRLALAARVSGHSDNPLPSMAA
jgi:hypothetical protein